VTNLPCSMRQVAPAGKDYAVGEMQKTTLKYEEW
jgi:hypothetical protein